MIRQIFSKVDHLLLASVIDVNDISSGRHNSADEQQILQVSAMQLISGQKVNAHRHLSISRNTTGTQECWVILTGLVSVQIFDIDQMQIDDFLLSTGTCLTTYRGGHALQVLQSAKIIEIKNGPYYGAKFDSQSIN